MGSIKTHPSLFFLFKNRLCKLSIISLILTRLVRSKYNLTVNLTTRGKYAVTASLDLAINNNSNAYIAISEIAERQSIPAPYLEQLFRYLRKAGILTSLRGPGGGYRLTRPTSEIKIGEIISAVEKRMDATHCGGEGNCSAGSKCLAHNLWTELNNEVDLFLMNKSLDDVIKSNLNEKKQIADNLLIATG